MAAIIPFPLFSQENAQVDESLKSLMVLFQNYKDESRAEIEKLKQANEELSRENYKLFLETERANERVAALEKEILTHVSNRTEDTVKKFEMLALARPADLFPDTTSEPESQPPTKPAKPSTKKVAQTVEKTPLWSSKEPIPDPLTDGTILLVNINTASEKELRLVPGVGGNLAADIVANRPYNSIWDLMRLEGIGKKRTETLGQYMTVK